MRDLSLNSLWRLKIYLVAVFCHLVLVQGIRAREVLLSERSFNFTYSFTIRDIPAYAKNIRTWVPVPSSNDHQLVSDVQITCGCSYTLNTDPEYGNSILYFEMEDNLPESLQVIMSFKVMRKGYQVQSTTGEDRELVSANYVPDAGVIQRFLLPDRLVPVDGKIAQEMRKVVREEMPPLEKAATIYDHIIRTVKYDKSGAGWGRGDALYACDVRRGNCTDFHALFTGLCRAAGIPARFVIGFPLPDDRPAGEIAGYHCWAEFFLEGCGWIPVDASEGSKCPEKREFFFGSLDANRIQFTLGRDIQLVPRTGIEPLNYFIYPYVLLAGKPYSNVERRTYFTE